MCEGGWWGGMSEGWDFVMREVLVVLKDSCGRLLLPGDGWLGWVMLLLYYGNCCRYCCYLYRMID